MLGRRRRTQTTELALALAVTLLASPVIPGCGADDGPASCDPAQADVCESGLSCVTQGDGSGLCQIPPGGACDPEEEDPNCAPDSLCQAKPQNADPDAPSHLCLSTRGGSCDPLDPHCAQGLTCAALIDETFACHTPLLARGAVTDVADASTLGNAHIIALNEEGVAVTGISVSDPTDGSYTLPVPAVRDMDGKPVEARYTLRASAQGYQTFPGGLRTAIPISTAEAKEQELGWVIEGATTNIGLIAIPDDGVTRYSLSGQIVTPEGAQDPETRSALAGVLVVADGPSVISGISDKDGHFTLFNLDPGGFMLNGYAAGLAVEGREVSVTDVALEGVELSASLSTLATVSGNVQIVNADGGSKTSVILVVEDTFDEMFVRGEVPKGLRAPRSGPVSVTGDFSIEGVPDGRYVALAAFENDLLVRDPDTNISGTNIVRFEVSGSDVSLSESFKVTQALAIQSPGAGGPSPVTSAPTLTWTDDSSEDWYEVRVYDAFGEEVWNDLMVPSVSGSDDVTLAYGGPMEVGMYYQFRVTSWRKPGNKEPAPISASEDLLGVFYVVQEM